MNEKEEEIKFANRRQSVSLKNLFLDTNNYRFIDDEAYKKTEMTTKAYTSKTNQTHALKLIKGVKNANITDLIESFKTNGFLEVDQIQVRELEQGKYLVIEGNRRTATLKFLETEFNTGVPIGNLNSKIFSAVPVVIYTDNNEQHHRILMGLKHINGTKRWPAINQAQLLQDLEDSGMPEIEIRKAIGGMTKLTYNRYLFALKLVNEYRASIYGDQFQTTMFNIFAEIMRKSELTTWLEWNEKERVFKNQERKNRLFSWLSEETKTDEIETPEDGDITDNNKDVYVRIITRGEDVRKLAQFIADEEALQKMEESRDVVAGLNSSDIVSVDKFNSTLDMIEKQLNLAYAFSTYARPNSKVKLQELSQKVSGLTATLEGVTKTETEKRINKLNITNVSRHFSDIKIVNYKAFKNVAIENLRRINLFAGVNNAGKSTLLEAVFFLVKQNDVFSFFDMHRRRGKFLNRLPSVWIHKNLQDMIELKGNFNNQITTLKIRKENEGNGNGENNDIAYLSTLYFEAAFADENANSSYDLYEDNTSKAQIKVIQELCNVSYSSPFSNMDEQQLSKLYNDNIKNLDTIIQFIQTNIDVNFKDIRINTSNQRFEVVYQGFENTQDLTQFGDGVQRVFHIALQFASARNGIVLIDEIENAIHHSLFKKMIPFIKQLAEQFNVQAFITSHSKECIDAFFEDEAYNKNIAAYRLNKNDMGEIIVKRNDGELQGRLIKNKNADLRGGLSK